MPRPSEEVRNAYKKFMFFEEYNDEFDAFHKYLDFIRNNGLYNKIINDIENMGVVCDLSEEVVLTYKDQKLNLTSTDQGNLKNGKMSSAMDFVRLRENSEKGKYLQAAEDISAETIIINERPVIYQVAPICKCVGDSYDSLYKCHHCGLTIGDFYPCLNCNICIFCTKTCLENARSEYHGYECYAFQRHFWAIFDNTDFSYLSLRIFLHGAKQKFDLKEMKKPEKNNYSFIYATKTHFDKMSKEQINKILYNCTRNVLYLKTKTHFFSNIKWLNKHIKQKDFVSYIGGLMVKHYCHAQINSINITFPNLLIVNGLQSSCGYGKAICPTISLINHSCKPNSTIMVYSDGVAVKSLVPIKEEEEITVCYSEINTFMSLEERRMIAKHFFFFTCKCALCETEMNAMENQYKCPICQKCNVTNIENIDGKVTAQCGKCETTVSMTSSVKQLELAIKYKESYELTKDIDYLVKILRCYRALVSQNSIHMLDICRVLYNRYRNRVNNIEAIRYGLLMFEIFENNIPKLHFPLLNAKFLFLMNFRSIELPLPMTEEELGIIKEYVNVALRIKQDITFYMPVVYITDYALLQREVARMMIQLKKQASVNK
ncbi:uncharacterized protein LOC130897319 [Diorhabda carinulata]|uniref:uncharacterized protein LOC130897319 n=1 Tax=Diorhabda carinulata TaxID=1163345 RepID=UPI0025A25D6A|nr:uncharacterized protein LOC130897319 [Diorhabda carinulata]XP_057662085.1 uncharacterized protein LOC130897319 [Diorhabda carinulata]